MNKYRLQGGPSDGVIITFPAGRVPVQRFLYLNGALYWITTFAPDQDGTVVLEWGGGE